MKTHLGVAFLAAAITLATAARADTFGSGDNQFNIGFVGVGDAGNPDDSGTTGSYWSPHGGVDGPFRMGTHEVSRGMIGKANAAGNLGITLQDMTGCGGNVGTHPATGVSWNEAARFVNWLNTSTGHQPAYKFQYQPGDAGYSANADILLWEPGDSGYDPANPYRNANARYFLPSEDEWYKAAYYSGNGTTYFDYATASDTIPTATAGGTAAGTVVYDQDYTSGPADVMNAGGPSHYGTMGQNGNAWEWMESAYDSVNDSPSEDRTTRGGCWCEGEVALRSQVHVPHAPEYDNELTGFRVASVPHPLPAIYNLGTLTEGGYSSRAFAINDSLQVTGWSRTGDTPAHPAHAFLYTGTPGSSGVMHDLGTLGGSASQGFAVNTGGQVAGRSHVNGDGAEHAFLYSGTPGSGGAMADLGTLGGSDSQAWAVNDSGQVAGDSDVTGDTASHAFLHTGTPGSGGAMADLGTLGGAVSQGFAINTGAQMAGWSQVTGDTAFHAFLYTGTPGSGGVMTDLGTLGGTNSKGLAINDSGQVAGAGDVTGDTASHAFLYTGTPGSGGVMTDLGTLGGSTSEGCAINTGGHVAGRSDQAGDSIEHAFLYTGTPGVDGRMHDLDAWLDANNPVEGAKWTLTAARGISDSGWIVGYGDYNDGAGGLSDGERAFLLDARTLTGATLTAIEYWRLAHFGTIENAGDAADTADPEHDSVPNLLEFGFGLEPTVPDAQLAPQIARVDDTLTTSFTRPTGVGGVVYGAEWSTNLIDWSASGVDHQIVGDTHTFTVSTVGHDEKMFMRLRVTLP